MAKVHNNLVLHGTSGMLGRQIVIRRRRGGGYILSAAPTRDSHRRSSPAQAQHRERFRQAVLYGKAAQGKPEYQALAVERNLTAFNVATADFLNPPEILGIDGSGYTGAIGQTIVVRAVDDVKVASVGVQLAADDGTPIEKGQAVVSPLDPQLWIYTTTSKAPSSSAEILVDATDLAGQVAHRSGHT